MLQLGDSVLYSVSPQVDKGRLSMVAYAKNFPSTLLYEQIEAIIKDTALYRAEATKRMRIFQECHPSLRNSAYSKIAVHYIKKQPVRRPKGVDFSQNGFERVSMFVFDSIATHLQR